VRGSVEKMMGRRKHRGARWLAVAATLLLAAVIGPVSADAEEGLSPLTVRGTETVSTEQAHKLFLEGVPFVDVRNARLYTRRHIPGAHHLDLYSAFDKAALESLVAKDQPVVIYCSGQKCSRSSTASEFAVDWGFTGVKYYRDGIVGWRDAGLPMKEES
jgi:rhodanese-related sulfurtransferase